ncbi:hypothetical protein [Actinoplanes solisilvae]|uniref:hypothetical protein n=1 Tax=Actinoplanes solisilvae TaxID=2486853 RepID=UPI000FD96DE8|nr:hypothetical protein [Actinoplanes solisilvae]
MSAAALGGAAFLADFVPGTAGRVVVTLTSSGLAWGVAALIGGFGQRDRRSAITVATFLLLCATTVYYLLILTVSQRWRGGHIQGVSSADLHSLLSMARATAFWTVASLCAGPVLGMLAWRIRVGGRRESAVLTGLAFGLFSAEAWHDLFFYRQWLRLDVFGIGWLVSGLAILLAAVTTTYLARHRPSSTRLVLTSAALSAVAGTALWWSLEHARVLVSV